MTIKQSVFGLYVQTHIEKGYIMIKEKIIVPAGIRYISDWAKLEGGYKLEDYQYPHIINKQITGCGFTEYCLTSDLDVVLCSPRKILLENKESQHEGDVLYVNNFLGTSLESSESYDTEMNKKTQEIAENNLVKLGYSEVAAKKTSVRATELKNLIYDYISERQANNKPSKILVTYDSFRHVKEILTKLKLMEKFFIVVDEFQSIFVDSRFKSTTELEFSGQLSNVKNLCYVSATPMMDEYLDAMSEFKDLPYYEFDWAQEDGARAVTPRLIVKATKSITAEATKIISDYRLGKFKTSPVFDKTGRINEIKSEEAVLYFNSVKHICGLIKKLNLTQDECNILCARSSDNEEKIRKAFGVKKSEFQGIGKVPKKGEPHKMFTFCTRTVYLGADFYSTNARSFVFSDANIDSLAVDISLDLPQILGRQRLDENPWKNSATLFFKPLIPGSEVTKEEFDEYVEKKVKETKKIIEGINSITIEENKNSVIDKIEGSINKNKYQKDYVSVNHHSGSKPVLAFNTLVMLSERRAFDIQQVDFKDRFRVFATLQDSSQEYDVKTDLVTEALARFDSFSCFPDKMRFLCSDEYSDSIKSRMLFSIPEDFVRYYRVLGPETITKLRFRRVDLETEYRKILTNQGSEEAVKTLIYKTFEVGYKYLPSLVKAELKQIYSSCEFVATAKSTDLNKYFNTRENKIESNGKITRAVEILSIKDDISSPILTPSSRARTIRAQLVLIKPKH